MISLVQINKAMISYCNDHLKINVSFFFFSSPCGFVLNNQHLELQMLKLNLKKEILLPPTVDVCPRCYGNMSACFSSLVLIKFCNIT